MTSETVTVTFVGSDAGVVRNSMARLLHEGDKWSDTSFAERENALEARAELAEARNKSLQSVLDEKNAKIAALVREAGVTSADVINNAYKDGEKDGKAEALQEQAYTNKLTAMTAHDDVLITMQRGVAPFHFRPQHLTTLGRVSPEYLADNQRGMPSTMAVLGYNMLTGKMQCITTVDSWTLCPKHMTTGLAPLA